MDTLVKFEAARDAFRANPTRQTADAYGLATLDAWEDHHLSHDECNAAMDEGAPYRSGEDGWL